MCWSTAKNLCEIFVCVRQMRDLLDVSATLATQGPRVPVQYPTLPAAAGNTVKAGCLRCSGQVKEGYEDMPSSAETAASAAAAASAALMAPPVQQEQQQQQPAIWTSTADDLLFADDEFATGQVDAPPPAPYADPLSNPAATMYAGSVNMLSASANLSGVTPPTQFRAAVGAAGLGTPTSFAAPPPTVQAPAVSQTTTTSTTWMPMGLTNTQALALAVLVCTGVLLLLFIVGMSSAPAAPAPDQLPLGLV